MPDWSRLQGPKRGRGPEFYCLYSKILNEEKKNEVPEGNSDQGLFYARPTLNTVIVISGSINLLFKF